MNSVTVKVIGLLVSLFIIITIASQMYISFRDKPDTQEATFVKISNSSTFKGVFVRNEKPLEGTADGVVNYLYKNGSKVSQGAVVANVYSNEDSIVKKMQIDSLNKEIESLSKIVNPGTEIIAQPEFISNQIDSKYQELQYNIAHNNIDKISELKNDVNVLMSIQNLLTKSEDKKVFTDRLAQLKSQRDELQAGMSKASKIIKSEYPGYFVGYTDGYEKTFSIANVDSITPEEIEKITSSDISHEEGSIGKVIDSYNSYIIGIVNLKGKIIQGKNLRIRITGSSVSAPVKLESLTQIDDSDKYKVVLSCEDMNDEIVSGRVKDIELVFDEYSGLKVPRKAIRFKDGVKGVYVSIGQNVVFKKLDILYEGTDYVISKNTADRQFVVLYDQVLLEEVSHYETTTRTTESTTSVTTTVP